MEKKEIVKYLDEIFYPIGFKKKGNTWKNESEVLEKIITLQKSKYSNAYYLNYGFTIKNLDLNNLEMHVFNRLSSFDNNENQKIMDLLDLDNNITDEQRKAELKPFIDQNMLNELQRTNSETELLDNLKKRPHINDVPLIVKKYFHLE